MPRRTRKKPTRPRNILAREREDEALELRKAGATYRMIGIRLGITKQSAHARVASALADLKALTAEQAEDVRALEIERLDAMLLGLWDRARKGDEQAVSACLKISKRRAELLGIDAPDHHVLSGPDGAVLPPLVEVVFVNPQKKNTG